MACPVTSVCERKHRSKLIITQVCIHLIITLRQKPSDKTHSLLLLFLITMAAAAPANTTPRRISPAVIPRMGMVGLGGSEKGRERKKRCRRWPPALSHEPPPPGSPEGFPLSPLAISVSTPLLTPFQNKGLG